MHASRFRFLHAADIHLDSALGGLEQYEGAPAGQVRNATRQAFDNLIELALDEKVAFVLLAGDLYDGDWKDYNTGLYFNQCMSRLSENGIRVFIISGNHDAASQITRNLRLPENVAVFPSNQPQKLELEDLNVILYGQSYGTRAVLEDLSQGYPQGESGRLNIGLLHTCLNGKPGHEPYAPCTVDGLRSKGYQYWALGHVHTREIVSRDPWIVFPGNTQGRHVRETGPKGCTLVTVQDDQIVHVEHRDLDVLRWAVCRLELSGPETLEEIYDQVRSMIRSELDSAESRPVALRLILEGPCSVHDELNSNRDKWMQEYRALSTTLGSAWVEKVEIRTRRALSYDEALDRDDALSGLLRTIGDMELDADALDKLVQEVYPLHQKLPPELLTGADAFDPTDHDVLKGALVGVKALLVNRLLSSEKDS